MLLKYLSYLHYTFKKPWRYSVFLAYIFYLIGGVFGLHLIYLRRYRHAFVSFSSFGGGCMLGLIYDFIHIPSYVSQANDLRFHKKIDKQKRNDSENADPRPDTLLLICQIAYSMYIGIISLSLFPREFTLHHAKTFLLLQALCVGLGSHTAANSGSGRCALKACMMGAFLPVPFFISADSVSLGEALLYSSVVSAAVAYFTGWRELKPEVDSAESHTMLRIICCVLSYFLFLGVLSQMVLWNITYTNDQGRRVSLGGQLEDGAERWQEWRDRMWTAWNEKGWWGFFFKLLEPSEQLNAYKVLGLSSNASQREISEQYKRLVKLWHPDKFAKESLPKQRWAEKQFMLLRKAYEELRSRRL